MKLGSNNVIEWMGIAGAVGKAVAGSITKEIVAAGKAKIFPGEVEKAVAAGIKAAQEEDEKLSPTQHLFYSCDDKNVRDFLGQAMSLPATLLELRKPLEQKGTPDIDCLVRVFDETAKELALKLENGNLRRWIKTFAEVYFQKTSAITTFLVTRERYLAALVKSCDDIKFVGIDAAVREVDRSSKLLDIFVVPNVAAEVDRSNDREWREREKLAELAEDNDLLLEQRQRLERDRSSAPMLADRLLHGQQRLVLLGDPGSGKTTLMRYLAVKLAQGNNADLGLTDHDDWLPMLIYMRDWAKNPERSLFEQLADFAKSTLHVDLPTGFFQYWWQGRSLVLLDGLDEVVDEAIRADLVNKLGCVLNEAEQNAIVITSRPWGYHRAYFRTESFPHFELLPFNDQQIKQFVENWYRSRHANTQDAQLMIDNLQESLVTNDRVQQLVTNPLLLTIVALIHRYQDELPKRRYQLYDKAVNTLLKSWDRTEKGLGAEQKNIFKCLDRDDDLRRVLSLLAKWIHEQPAIKGQSGGTLIREKQLIEQLIVIITKLKPDKAEHQLEAEAKRFVDFIRDRTGLINEYGQGIYGFVHKTFQEYLTAEAIQKETRYNLNGMLLFMKEHLHQQHWREVILLLASQQEGEGAARVIETILQAGSDYEQWFHRDLLLAGECLTEDPMELKLAGQELGQEILVGLVNLVVSSDRLVGFRVKKRVTRLLCRLRGTEFEKEALAEIEKRRDEINQFELLKYRFYLEQPETTIFKLLVFLQDPEYNVRSNAVSVLGELGKNSCKVLDVLLELLQDDNSIVQISVVSVLVELGEKSDSVLDALLDLLQDDDSIVRINAVSALGLLGKDSDNVLDALLGLLKDPEYNVQISAASALGELGKNSDEVLDILLDLLQDHEYEVRSNAVFALGKLGKKSQKVLNVLLGLLKHGNYMIRSKVASVLGGFSCNSGKVLDVLLDLLKDDNPQLRESAIFALGKLGNNSDRVLDMLLGLLKDDRSHIRGNAVLALGELGKKSDKVLEKLLNLLQDANPGVVTSTVYALGRFGDNSAKVLDVLIDLLGNANPGVRSSAVYSLELLGNLPQSEILPKLLFWIETQPQDSEVGNAIDILWQIIEG
jgi:HEAT repeat protein/energy-coupling factor transporter ATP-binding protein EcfA2